ncbi:hypothetical protein [Amycolatopsis sp. lyj-112]|uniref:hypothetical protein n=1 Tax=Amycolatopsis sp. lyj-112 TaxID=2789288 RepID=UPI00397BAF24
MTGPGWNGPPQQPYGHQPGWGHPPPKKKRLGLMITLIAVPAVLLLGGGLTAFLFYQDAHKDGGSPPSSARLGKACAAVSPQTLARLRTTNPYADLSREQQGHTSCVWEQTEGKDGEGSRQLTFQVTEAAVDRTGRQLECEGTVLAPPNIGDQSCTSIKSYGGASRMGQLQFVENGKFVLIQYQGWDVGLFDTVPMPDEELTKAVLDIANEVAGKIG